MQSKKTRTVLHQLERARRGIDEAREWLVSVEYVLEGGDLSDEFFCLFEEEGLLGEMKAEADALYIHVVDACYKLQGECLKGYTECVE